MAESQSQPAQEYAQWLRSASQVDRPILNEHQSLKASKYRQGSVVAQLKRIKADLDAREFSGGQPLGYEVLQNILAETSLILGMRNSELRLHIKSVNADSAEGIVKGVEQIINSCSSIS